LGAIGRAGRTVGRRACGGQVIEHDLARSNRYRERIDGGVCDAGVVQLREPLPHVVELCVVDLRHFEFGQSRRI